MRTLNVGGNQGRGNPPLSRSTNEGRGMLVSPYFYVGGAISLAIWAYVIAVVFA